MRLLHISRKNKFRKPHMRCVCGRRTANMYVHFCLAIVGEKIHFKTRVDAEAHFPSTNNMVLRGATQTTMAIARTYL